MIVRIVINNKGGTMFQLLTISKGYTRIVSKSEITVSSPRSDM